MNSCIFCAIIAQKISADIVQEDADFIVIRDKYPKASTHILIIPKVHVSDITVAEHGMGDAIFDYARKLANTIPDANEFKLVINNGFSAGQRIFHLHAHFLAGVFSESV